MKKLFLVLLLLPISLLSQEKGVSIALQGGYFLSDTYYDIVGSGRNIGLDVYSRLSNKWELVTHANYGQNTINLPPRMKEFSNYPTATVSQIHIGLMLAYNIKLKERIKVRMMTGISIYNENMEYMINVNDNTSFNTSVNYNVLAFPLRVSALYSVNKRFNIGLLGGFHFDPDSPFTGLHFGPQIEIKL